MSNKAFVSIFPRTDSITFAYGESTGSSRWSSDVIRMIKSKRHVCGIHYTQSEIDGLKLLISHLVTDDARPNKKHKAKEMLRQPCSTAYRLAGTLAVFVSYDAEFLQKKEEAFVP